MTRSWRHESIALLALWLAASALILAAARLRPPPLRPTAVTRVPFVPVAPPRRPPTPRRPAAGPAVDPVVDAPVESPDPDSEPTSIASSGLSVSTDHEVSVTEEFDDESGSVEMGDYRWSYRSHSYGNSYNRSWRFRRGRILRPSASRFFSVGAVPAGASGDPCAVFPDACAAPPTSVGGSYDPPRSLTRIAATAQTTVATVSREPGRWLLLNALITAEIDVAALCRVTTRRLGDAYPSVASFAAPSAEPCTVHETAAPWTDRTGVAVELAWNDPAGSMRAVVALADDGAALEASVARIDRSGRTWLTNLGAETLTWNIAGVPVTVAPGGAVQVSASAGARSVATVAPTPAARSSSRS